jgi:hypothetical protein
MQVHRYVCVQGRHEPSLQAIQIEEIVIDYTNCGTDAPNTTDPTSALNNPMPSNNYELNFKTTTNAGDVPQWRAYDKNVTYYKGVYNETGGQSVPTRVCQIQFTIPNDIGPPVFLYYRLSDFFQNHRRYVKSYDSNQLLGSKVLLPTASCYPLDTTVTTIPTATPSTSTVAYYPCGLVANSLFNDTILPPVVQKTSADSQNYSMTNSGIAWSSDAKLYGKTQYSLDEITPPPDWRIRWPEEGYTEDNPPPDLDSYQEFQVWMRTAALPYFNKLALRNDTGIMRKGTYLIEVHLSTNITRDV